MEFLLCFVACPDLSDLQKRHFRYTCRLQLDVPRFVQPVHVGTGSIGHAMVDPSDRIIDLLVREKMQNTQIDPLVKEHLRQLAEIEWADTIVHPIRQRSFPDT